MVGGNSTDLVPVAASPEIVMHVDSDIKFDVFLLGSQGLIDAKTEMVKQESAVQVEHGIDVNAVPVDSTDFVNGH
eukprot:5792328-Amphidinium_carterae.2